MLKIAHSPSKFDSRVISARLAQNRVELVDVAALLEEVNRLQMENMDLQMRLADAETELEEARPVWDAYRGVANFPVMAEVFYTMLKRMDHTAD